MKTSLDVSHFLLNAVHHLYQHLYFKLEVTDEYLADLDAIKIINDCEDLVYRERQDFF